MKTPRDLNHPLENPVKRSKEYSFLIFSRFEVYVPKEYFMVNAILSNQKRSKNLPLKGSFHSMRQKIIHKLGVSEELFDFLTQCLTLDPNERISVEDALKHSFFTKVDK
jgi:serine/threonine protein kinase